METVRRFRVGYAPASWDALQKHLQRLQIPGTVAEQLGLLGVNERGAYDFFRDRVMLPVLDSQKRPVGFSSRLLDPDAKDRKYVNSPDSPLFHKKQVLYGLHAALDAIRRGGVAIVVEGNFDVLSLHVAGIEEAVAPMGTALTTEQIALLGRYARTVVVVFDGDEAGQRAARKVVPMFVEADVDGRVARLPTGVDPDDFVRANGAEAFRRLVDQARPMVEQFIDDLARDVEPASPARVRALEAAAPLLAQVRNPTARDLYAGRLAAALGMDAAQVARAIRGVSAAARRGPSAAGGVPAAVARGASAAETASQTRTPPRDEMEAFLLLVAHPELHAAPDPQRALDLLVDPGIRHICRVAVESLARGERADVPAWLEAAPADIREALGRAVMEGGRRGDAATIERAWRALLSRLSRSRVEAELALAEKQHSEALARGDDDAARAIRRREIELIQTREGLSNALARP
jgi:DNA primase